MGASFVKKPGIYPIKGNKLNPLDDMVVNSPERRKKKYEEMIKWGSEFAKKMKKHRERKGELTLLPRITRKEFERLPELRRLPILERKKLPEGWETWEKEMKKRYPSGPRPRMI